MSAEFNIDFEQLSILEEKLSRLPGNIEEVINDVLHNEGIKLATEEITKLIPVSRWKNKTRSKNHAKFSKWSKSEKHNLGFTIKAKGGAANKKGSFGYLVFPNEGRGVHNLVEQHFMERGLENALPQILEILSNRIDDFFREEL
ncbi:hypothetical protein LS684_04400 [Cytobacillus spongiae]|uniref:hypothetical protein n=1 Tax=Cytobacillus spongiae TaxID=2901381 RepID=UPI001F2C89D7|nr:hypothetical protein [Cytobacillus spongiae]UII56712.1 hypothetical protein LS684_04400 [Cytobacillus spongiae]